jgi:hypothetical protein
MVIQLPLLILVHCLACMQRRSTATGIMAVGPVWCDSQQRVTHVLVAERRHTDKDVHLGCVQALASNLPLDELSAAKSVLPPHMRWAPHPPPVTRCAVPAMRRPADMSTTNQVACFLPCWRSRPEGMHMSEMVDLNLLTMKACTCLC